MASPITVGTLFRQHKKMLMLSWVTGEGGADRAIVTATVNGASDDPLPLVGFLNVIKPNRIQVVGSSELEFLQGLGKNSYTDTIARLFSTKPAAIILAEGIDVPDVLKTRARNTQTPLLQSNAGSHKIVNHLRYYLTQLVSQHVVMPGVFMEVLGIGVLLTGPSGIGKSELALELVSRGHRLVADDAPLFMLSGPDTIKGSCPPPLRDFIEVRGLGVLNIRAMFGDSAVKNTKQLRLVIHIEYLDDEQLAQVDRLRGSQDSIDILGIEITQIVLPVAAGRNFAVLVEAAVRNHVLVFRGYNAADDFLGKHDAQLIAEDKE
ncbi:MAG: HPr(Ser) kinase/phosphatase [Gammaproteobacteria bacterium]|nr:MAG: HPr(Ser) kinase/phosphatase [Gammaproteobacteria bacterium]